MRAARAWLCGEGNEDHGGGGGWRGGEPACVKPNPDAARPWLSWLLVPIRSLTPTFDTTDTTTSLLEPVSAFDF
jgi:hypothetical protein